MEESKAGEGDEERQDGGSCNFELILFSWKIALRRWHLSLDLEEAGKEPGGNLQQQHSSER